MLQAPLDLRAIPRGGLLTLLKRALFIQSYVRVLLKSLSPVVVRLTSTPDDQTKPRRPKPKKATKKQAQKLRKKNARPKQAMTWPPEPSRALSLLTFLRPRPHKERGYGWTSFVRCSFASRAQLRHASVSSCETGLGRHGTNPWWRFALGEVCLLVISINSWKFDHRPARPRAADDRSSGRIS